MECITINFDEFYVIKGYMIAYITNEDCTLHTKNNHEQEVDSYSEHNLYVACLKVETKQRQHPQKMYMLQSDAL